MVAMLPFRRRRELQLQPPLDRSPFICRTSIRNLYLNEGWCRQGFKATPASGWCFAHTIAIDEERALNRCYSLDRFESDRELDEDGVGNLTYKQ
jgi:glycine/D-amino acid oxidase-like deaminating enzyme